MLGRGIEVALPVALSPRPVKASKILLEDQPAMAHYNHAVNVGLGFFQSSGNAAKPRVIEADAVR